MVKSNIERFKDILRRKRLEYGEVYNDIHFKIITGSIVKLYFFRYGPWSMF